MYRPNTASVQPNVVNGKTFYYLVESAQVGGQAPNRVPALPRAGDKDVVYARGRE